MKGVVVPVGMEPTLEKRGDKIKCVCGGMGCNRWGYCAVIGFTVWSKFVGITLYGMNLKNENRSKWSESRVIDMEMLDGMQFGALGESRV